MAEYYSLDDFANDYNAPLPLALIFSPQYADVSPQEKIMYAVLKYRMQLSARSGEKFSDDMGLYIYFKQEELAESMHCSLRTVKRIFSDMKEHGLIATRRVGVGSPSRIYLTKLSLDKCKPCHLIDDTPNTSYVQGVAPIKERTNTREQIHDNREYGHTPSRRATFVKPTVEEVQAYINEKGFTFSAESFIDYYESNGWMVGRTHMKDWKATCRNWQRNERKPSPRKPSTREDISQNDYSRIEKLGWDA